MEEFGYDHAAATNSMDDLLGKLNSITEGTPPPPKRPVQLPNGNSVPNLMPSPSEIKAINDEAMTALLNKLNENEIFDYNNALKPEDFVVSNPQPQSMDDEISRMAQLDQLYGGDVSYEEAYNPNGIILNEIKQKEVQAVHQAQALKPQNTPVSNPSLPWTLIAEDVTGLKNVKTFSIRSSYNKQVIVDSIMMQEAAISVLNVLNNGGKLTDPKVLGIISYGISYTKLLEKAMKSLHERKLVLKESNYTKAAELDVSISDYKLQAKELRNVILKFISDNNFSTKM